MAEELRHRPYVRSFAGGVEDMPTYILRTLGKDRSWMEKGSCRKHDLSRANAWTRGPNESVPVGDVDVRGSDLIAAALKVCAGCPVQWECALWAAEIREETGTWAMRHDDLEWLWSHPNPQGIVNKARLDGKAVQHAVHDARYHGV